MECNKDEAVRAKELAQKKMQNNDFDGARRIGLKAQQLFPELDNISHLLAVCNVHCSAQNNKLASEKDWYSILQVERSADDATIRKQYRKLALMLHPDKNKFPGAEAAFKLIGEAHLVLSDRGKRSMYDSKLGISIKSSQAKPPSQQVNKNPSARKQHGFQNNIPNSFSNQFNGLNQTTQSNSSVSQECFWTCCPFCNIKYQYYRTFVNRALRCQRCTKPFIAYDIAAQGVPPRTNQSQAATQGVPPRSNWSQPPVSQQKEIPVQGSQTGTKETAGFLASSSGSKGSTSCRTVGSDSGTQMRSTVEVGSDLNTQKSTNSVGGSTEGVATSKVDETKPGEASLRDKKRKRGKTLEAESSESCDTSSSSDSEEMIIEESVSDLAAGQNAGVTGFYECRRSSRQKHQVSYLETEGEDDDLESLPKRSREGKSFSDKKGQQEGVVDADLHCENPFKQKESDTFKGSSPQGNNELGKNQTTGQAAGEPENGAKRVEIIDDSESGASSADEQGPVVFDCPDPEFNDFDKDREESCFAIDQFWACYGNADGMPRFYAQIRKVFATGFKLRITWLEPDPDDEDEIEWVNKELPVGCGKYRRGDTQDTTDRLTFSHRIICKKGSKKGSFIVYPRKGETWALFEDWDIKWSTEPENHQSHGYAIVEVLTDFVGGVGIKVAPLDKVKGFVSLFHHRSESRAGEFFIPPNEMFRFSHRIPSFKMTGTDKEGVPEGSFELDPASLPADDVCNPSKFKMNDKSLGDQVNSACQESLATKSKSKMSENVSTPKKSVQYNCKIGFDGEDCVLRRSPRGLNTANKENKQVNASHLSSQSGSANYLNSREGRSCKAEVLSRQAEELDQQVQGSSPRRSNSITSSISPSRNVSQDLFYDFKSDRLPGKFEVGQIWALYKPEDKLPKVYGEIKKVGSAPFMLHVALFEACSVAKMGIKLVCGSFKAQNGRPQAFEPSCFSHLLDTKIIIKNRLEIYPKEGQIWALYKSWNSEPSSSDMANCEYEVVEIVGNSNGCIKVSSLVPVKGYKSVFRSPRKNRSSIGPMDITKNELARFSHQIPAFQLTTEKGGSLAGCWELDPAAVPCNVLPAK